MGVARSGQGHAHGEFHGLPLPHANAHHCLQDGRDLLRPQPALLQGATDEAEAGDGSHCDARVTGALDALGQVQDDGAEFALGQLDGSHSGHGLRERRRRVRAPVAAAGTQDAPERPGEQPWLRPVPKQSRAGAGGAGETVVRADCHSAAAPVKRRRNASRTHVGLDGGAGRLVHAQPALGLFLLNVLVLCSGRCAAREACQREPRRLRRPPA